MLAKRIYYTRTEWVYAKVVEKTKREPIMFEC